MSRRPQQPELARTPAATPLDREAFERNARTHLPQGDEPAGPVPPANRPGHRPDRDADKPAFVSSRIELLRERRGEQRLSFSEICDHLTDYVRRNPEDEPAMQRLATFLVEVEDTRHDHEAEAKGGGIGS